MPKPTTSKPLTIERVELTIPHATAPFVDFQTPPELQDAIDSQLTNMQTAALVTLWNRKSMSFDTVTKLISLTTEVVKHRRNLYGLKYGAATSESPNRRLRVIPLD